MCSVLQVVVEDCVASSAAVLDLGSDVYAELSGVSTIADNRGLMTGFTRVGPSATALIESRLCASNNRQTLALEQQFTPGAADFAHISAGGVLRVADGALVQLDSQNADVFLETNSPYGELFCGSNSIMSWDDSPSGFQVTGDLCSCTGKFELGQISTCDSCQGAGWDPQLCACRTVRAASRVQGLAVLMGFTSSPPHCSVFASG